MQPREIATELRPHFLYDLLKEGAKMMLPFLAGLGIKEWVHQYATAFMWTAAFAVAFIVAYADRLRWKSRPIPNHLAGNQETDETRRLQEALAERTRERDGARQRIADLERDLREQATKTSDAAQRVAMIVKERIPVIGITLRSTILEPYDETPGRYYPRKLRMYMSNDGDDIHLGVGQWIPENIGIEPNKPPSCQYELKDHLGKWSGEASNKIVTTGKWLRLYVGLDSTANEKSVQQIAVDRSLGLLQIPAEIAGVKVTLRIRP